MTPERFAKLVVNAWPDTPLTSAEQGADANAEVGELTGVRASPVEN